MKSKVRSNVKRKVIRKYKNGETRTEVNREIDSPQTRIARGTPIGKRFIYTAQQGQT